MGADRALMMLMWQTSYDTSARDIHWIMISEVVLAGTLIVVLLALLIGGLVVWSKVNRLIEDAKKAAAPAIAKGTELFNDLAPKVRSITANVEQISTTARNKVEEVGQTVSEVNRTVVDVNGKARVQADRVHGMVTEALNTTHHVSQSVQRGITAPVRQVAGIVAGLKAGLETLIERSPFAHKVAGHKAPKPGPYDL